MRTYIRDRTDGATYFLTLNLLNRQSELLVQHIDELRIAYSNTQNSMPFSLDAMVVLPDHLHLMLTLPDNDNNYAQRVSCLKGQFSIQIPNIEWVNESRAGKGERGIWQRRFWEHRIRDDLDYQLHMNYIHYNPVKHRHVGAVKDWPYSTFHNCVRQGVYDLDWAVDGVGEFEGIARSDV
jgi:putative transposase